MFIFFWKNWFLACYTLKTSWGELAIYMSVIIFLAKSHCQPIPKPNTNNTTDTKNTGIICYTPKNDKFINNLMEGVRLDFGMPSNNLHSFHTEKEMLTFMNNNKADRRFAVTFSKYSGPMSITGTNMTYTIYGSQQSNVPRTFFFDKEYQGSDHDDYINSGVLNLKQVIDTRFRKLTEPKDSSTSQIRAEALRRPIKDQQPCNTYHDRITTYGLIFLIIIKKVLIRLVLAPLVNAKENGTKDFMALSMPYAALDDLAFFLNMFFFTFIYIALNIICSTIYYPFGEITYLHIYVLFILYLLSDMAYTFMVSTFFDSVFYGKVGGILFHYIPLVLSSANDNAFQKYSFMNGGDLFYQGIEIFQKYSINARNFGPDIGEGELLNNLYARLVLQFIAYIFLHFYFTAVIPGKGRKRQPFYFIIQPSFYFVKKEPNAEASDEVSSNKQGIKVINLKKAFTYGCRSQKLVLDDINVKIESNCITTLIGPNDSGKTTLIDIILGHVSQTAGDIIVEGCKNPKKYRQIIGFCPESNILLPYLTCKRNLIFFGCLKGTDFGNAEKNAITLLARLKIYDESILSSENLTPAIKRKLSLGIGLSGCTKVIILDQPTLGLDIVSRREIWDMLLELRSSKTVLIATNDMEEVEMLSDNVIVMDKGKIMQSLSALELKYQHGCDYILKLDIEETFNTQKALDLIHEFIPNAIVNTYSDTAISIRMPYSYRRVYTGLLSKLENNTNNLKITNISITNHFFDDAFIHLTKEDDDKSDMSMSHENHQNNKQYTTIVDVSTSYENIATTTISSREIIAIFYKKLVFIKRELFFSFFLFLIPIVSIALAFVAIHFHESDELQPVCSINGSTIYVKFSKQFQNLQDIINNDIRKNDGIPIVVSEDLVIENILKKNNYDQLTYPGEKVIVILEFDDVGNVIRVAHIGNSQTCRSKEIVKLIYHALSKIQEPVEKTMKVELVDLSIKGTLNPSMLKYYSSIVPVGWFICILFYVSLPHKEAITRFKQLQNISPLRYWTAFTLGDICLHIIICVFTFVQQKMFDKIYSGPDQATFMLSFMFYGFGYLPILYILAGAFKELSTIISCLIAPLIISAIFRITPSIGWNFVPDIGLKYQLLLVNRNYFPRPRNETIIEMQTETIKKHNYFIWFYGSMVVTLLSFSAILIFYCERRYFFNTSCQRPLEPTITTDNVEAEKKRVEDIIKENKQNECALIVNKVVTPYKSSENDWLPVPCLSFAIEPGECFGIVGINDSGKTQIIQQIMGNMKIKSGKVYIYSVKRNKNFNAFKLLTGYGMQVNALNDFMTPYEILKYIVLLRGFTDNEIPRVISDWMEKLDLTKFRNIPIKKCSYATKRKLCLCIAMIGKPAVIFLDDPTSGVDPKCRILMWKCIKQVQEENKAVILSTNNLDECEYLCSRIGVIHRGYMHNFGNIRQLKASLKYGCILTIKLRNEHLRAEINVLVAKLSEAIGGYITYRPPLIRYFVSEQPLLWSSIFARMQQLSEDHKNVIEDCNVKEVTIEGLLIYIPPVSTITAV